MQLHIMQLFFKRLSVIKVKLIKCFIKLYQKYIQNAVKATILLMSTKSTIKNNMTIILSDSSKSGKLKTGEKKQLNL